MTSPHRSSTGSRPGAGRTAASLLPRLFLGLSLGQSAVYSVVQLLDKMTRAPLAAGTSTLNRSQSTREYFDLTYQLLDILFALVPVLLVLYAALVGAAITHARREEYSAIAVNVVLGGLALTVAVLRFGSYSL